MLHQTVMRVLIAGAGITGAATAAALRQRLPETSQISIWDKAQTAGGRMATISRFDDDNSTVDIGAQYFTLPKEYRNKRQRLFDDLVDAGIFRPFQGVLEGDVSPNSQHYVTPEGTTSLVHHFLSNSGCEPHFQRHISKIEYEAGNDEVKVVSDAGETDVFNTVILTMPVPQILQLQGMLRYRIAQNSVLKEALERVEYSSRFCLGLFYNRGTEVPYEWDAKYFTDDPCIRFVALDNRKRGKLDDAPSVLVHTSVPFSLEHLEKDKEEMRLTILQHLRDILPDLPEPDAVYSHKFRYSQVYKGYDGAPGCIVLETKPLIILTGDAFAQKAFFCGVMDCVDKTVETVAQFITDKTSL